MWKVTEMFCSKCGEELPENANFCPRCGARTRRGIEAGISTPWQELKKSLSKMGKEMEKAFSMAAEEVEKAFRTIRESTGRQVVCPHCGEKNLRDANFCYQCGKRLD